MLRVRSVLFLLLNVCFFKAAIASTQLVYDGEELQDEIRRFLVKLLFGRYQGNGPDLCSGSIINWSWIITAAHCINTTIHHTIFVLHVMPLSSEVIAQVPISDAVRHPGFDFIDQGKDIALVPLNEPISINLDKKPVNIAAMYPSLGPTAVIAGFGKTEIGVSPPRQGTVTIIECPYLHNVICSKGKVRVGSGDSGGPLIFNGFLVGVISSTCIDAETNTMCISIYAGIAANIDWIKSVTKML